MLTDKISVRAMRAGTAAVVGCVAALASAQTDGVVAAKAEDAKPIAIGSSVPDATLRGLDGKAITLKEALGGKPSVLIFYRGGWCPFCNAHLMELAQVEKDVRAAGYQILAISPDTPVELAKTAEKDKLSYTLLSDSKVELMRKCGIAFQVDPETVTMYRDRFNLDLERASGEKHHVLPVPTVLLVDKEGKVTYAYSNPDYKVRLSGAELLKAAKKTAECSCCDHS